MIYSWISSCRLLVFVYVLPHGNFHPLVEQYCHLRVVIYPNRCRNPAARTTLCMIDATWINRVRFFSIDGPLVHLQNVAHIIWTSLWSVNKICNLLAQFFHARKIAGSSGRFGNRASTVFSVLCSLIVFRAVPVLLFVALLLSPAS